MLLAVFTMVSIPLSSTKIKTLQSQWLQGFFLYFQWFAGFLTVVFVREIVNNFTFQRTIFTIKLLTELLTEFIQGSSCLIENMIFV